jgi:hypothetical protein
MQLKKRDDFNYSLLNDAGDHVASVSLTHINFAGELEKFFAPRPGSELTPLNEAYRELAKTVHEVGGEVEIDPGAIVSISDDGGAYVAAWVWVDNSDLPEDFQTEPSETQTVNDERIEEPEREEPEAWQRYDLHTMDDTGHIRGDCSTNDNADLGHPNEFAQWRVIYKDEAEMLKRTGGTHTGISGIKVRVVLDGKEVPAVQHKTA